MCVCLWLTISEEFQSSLLENTWRQACEAAAVHLAENQEVGRVASEPGVGRLFKDPALVLPLGSKSSKHGCRNHNTR